MITERTRGIRRVLFRDNDIVQKSLPINKIDYMSKKYASAGKKLIISVRGERSGS